MSKTRMAVSGPVPWPVKLDHFEHGVKYLDLYDQDKNDPVAPDDFEVDFVYFDGHTTEFNLSAAEANAWVDALRTMAEKFWPFPPIEMPVEVF